MAQKWIDKIEKNNEEYDIYREGFEIGTNESGNYTLSLSNTPPVYNITDQVPYNFRPSGGDLNIGKKELDELVGGTVAWNQLALNGNFENTSAWSKNRCDLSVANNIGTFTCNSNEYASWGIYQRPAGVINNKCLVCCTVRTNATNQPVAIALASSGGDIKGLVGNKTVFSPTNNTWYDLSFIGIVNNTNATVIVNEVQNVAENVAIGDILEVKNFVFFDLTRRFGSTIADYAYGLEVANAGAGVAYFRNLFPKLYYPYNPGELISVKTSAHKMVGFNQWDEGWEVGSIDSSGANENSDVSLRSKNMIKVIPYTTYYAKSPSDISIFYYDVDKSFISSSIDLNNQTFVIPSNTHYIKFVATDYIQNYSTYKNDICINISYNGSNDGKYEPYTEHTYNLPNVELRGIFKLDSNNKLYCDGDIEKSDGTIIRKYGIVDLGTLTWAYNSTYECFYSTQITDAKSHGGTVIPNCVTSKGYTPVGRMYADSPNLVISINSNSHSTNGTYIKDTQYGSDANAFSAAMSGVYLVYELETPTEEKTNFFTNPQTVYNQGTEEYIDNREVAIPVGHNTKYDEPWEEIKN